MEEELEQQLRPHLSNLQKLGNQIQSQVPEDLKDKLHDDLQALEGRSRSTGEKAAERLDELADLEGRWSEYDDGVGKFASWLEDMIQQLDGVEKTDASPEETFNKAKVNVNEFIPVV